MLVTYKSGGQDIPTNVFSPSTAANGGLIILAYGSDGLVDSQNGPWKSMIEGYAMDLAAKGFLATIPEYFAASGTQPGDLNPSDPVGYMKQVLAHRAAWQTALEDAVSKLPTSTGIQGIHASRIGFLGFSLGGHLCARASHAVRASVIFFAPEFDGLGLNGTLSMKAEIHHGKDDFLDYGTNAVPISQALTKQGADCHLWPAYPGAVHGFVGNDQANTDARKESHSRTLAFFAANL